MISRKNFKIHFISEIKEVNRIVNAFMFYSAMCSWMFWRDLSVRSALILNFFMLFDTGKYTATKFLET